MKNIIAVEISVATQPLSNKFRRMSEYSQAFLLTIEQRQCDINILWNFRKLIRLDLRLGLLAK